MAEGGFLRIVCIVLSVGLAIAVLRYALISFAGGALIRNRPGGNLLMLGPPLVGVTSLTAIFFFSACKAPLILLSALAVQVGLSALAIWLLAGQ